MSSAATAPEAQPESRAAWLRLAAAMIVGTVACVGNWTVVVALPVVEQEFGSARAGASFPYACSAIGFAIGTMAMGRIADRLGVVAPILISAACMAIGYALAGLAPGLLVYALAHLVIGVGSSAGFAPIMADISHWFTKRRGLAVVMVATGSYFAGVLWPSLFQAAMEQFGWRAAHVGAGLLAAAVLAPMALCFRSGPSRQAAVSEAAASAAARADLGLSPRALQGVLMVAGFACCVAMAMPQVHIIAYCADLGYGPARGAQMLAVMLALGVVSRILSGVAADRFGGVAVLLAGSFMQAVALFLYLFFDGLVSLFVISAVFGLFQGGIVPMYAVVIRQFLPPGEAGMRIGAVITMTIIGMAAGGWMSGWIYDLSGSYRLAFLNGLVWNAVNLACTTWLFFASGAARRLGSAA